jgi:hypothetical protein
MKSKFSHDTLIKYKEIFDVLEIKNEAAERASSKTLFKGLAKKESDTKVVKKEEDQKLNSTSTSVEATKEQKEDKDTKISKPTQRSWLKWVLGPVLFVGGAVGMFFLVKNRMKFR